MLVRVVPSAGDDARGQLLQAVLDGNLRKARVALQAGAEVDGSPGLCYHGMYIGDDKFVPLIVAAVMTNQPGMVGVLLEHGADPDRPVPIKIAAPPRLGMTNTASPGERALHVAARSGRVKIVRLLLERSRADPNATDDAGYTPLSATAQSSQAHVEIVSLLLEAGADPALGDKNGLIPLHAVAQNGHMDLWDMLYNRAPATLNRSTARGETPLLLACHEGHDSMVSKLLSLGATQRTNGVLHPLVAATRRGFVEIVRLLVSEGGVWAAGGHNVWAEALCIAVHCRQAGILRLLLEANGEEKQSVWTYIRSDGGRRLLHLGASYCYPAAVSVLLKAGSDEAAGDLEGRIPRDVIGLDLGKSTERQMDRGDEVAVHRMLQRGPAYRARSWAWPSDEEADADGVADGDGATATATATARVLSLPPALSVPPVVNVRIFRPSENSSSDFFMSLVGRYCAKD